MSQFLEKYKENLSTRLPVKKIGFVREIVVSTVKAVLPQVTQGELCEIETIYGKPILAEVIAFSGNLATLTCLESVEGVHLGAKVTQLGKPHSVKAREEIFSSVMDGMGRNMEYPSDSLKGALSFDEDATPVLRSAPLALHRPPVSEKLITGVRVIDGLMTLGKGQRVGIFSPPGCGKSTLLAQIARGADVDTIVFALVGERGRELREFMENEITPDIRAKSIFVCATSDKAAIERVRAAFTAVSVAEYLRDQGKSVLLLVDSLTRLARAQRELGLMAGEPVTASGFTPSVYSLLPEVIERAGRTTKGCITAIYTVLTEKERLEDDPVASEAKSLLDGHIILSTKLVERAHFPAIDPLKSLSRVMHNIVTPEHLKNAGSVRKALSTYDEIELLLRIREYESGTDPLIDESVKIKPLIDTWAKQGKDESAELTSTTSRMATIVKGLERI